MFVFGEVQDPNMETVNLVEDIVRSQIIELVSILNLLRCDAIVRAVSRSSRPVHWQPDGAHGISRRRT